MVITDYIELDSYLETQQRIATEKVDYSWATTKLNCTHSPTSLYCAGERTVSTTAHRVCRDRLFYYLNLLNGSAAPPGEPGPS